MGDGLGAKSEPMNTDRLLIYEKHVNGARLELNVWRGKGRRAPRKKLRPSLRAMLVLAEKTESC